MFAWLMRKLRRKPAPTIRTFDDLTAAIRSGAITPRFSRVGDVQIADPFAETGLGPTERTKVMLRSFDDPAGVRMYVHRSCAAPFLEGLPGRDQAVYEPDTEEWSPTDLIGRFRDVTHCDHCDREFRPNDEGYVAYWVASGEELRLLEEVPTKRSLQRHRPKPISDSPGRASE
jgi:hypothetical protein